MTQKTKAKQQGSMATVVGNYNIFTEVAIIIIKVQTGGGGKFVNVYCIPTVITNKARV